MLVKMIRQFATAREVSQLRRWIERLHASGTLQPNPGGPARFFVPLGAVRAPAIIDRFSQELKAQLKLPSGCLDLRDLEVVTRTKATPSFVGLQLEGGAVHPHTDKNLGTYLQLRCTLLISKPDGGGRVIMANHECELDEGDVYCFLSNSTVHGATRVEGSKPRMTCSLGFLVSESFTLN